LSTFDGAHGFPVQAKIVERTESARVGRPLPGALAGDFWSGSAYHETWTASAMRTGVAQRVLAHDHASRVKDSEFAFPDLGGNIVTSKDAKFQHKVIVVRARGAAGAPIVMMKRLSSPALSRYQAKGLEIVSLMFEHFR